MLSRLARRRASSVAAKVSNCHAKLVPRHGLARGSTMNEPLVTVVTPVYNGARYLAECIESVLAQSYRNLEYVIVNNRSTDDTEAIALRYAERDARVRAVTNSEFVGVIQNHNIAFRQVSPASS